MSRVEAAVNAGTDHLLQTFRQAVVEDLTLLAALHDAEPSKELLQQLTVSGFPAGLGLRLLSEPAEKALRSMREALDNLPQTLESECLNELAADYTNIYLTHGLQASPCESVWFDEEQLTHQLAMFQVRQWYQRHGLVAADWRKREDDHLVLQLQFLAHLFGTENSIESLTQAARFMDEHLLRWLGRFAHRVAARCATDYFAALALLTHAYCEELRDLLVRVSGQSRPDSEEVEAQMKPKNELVPVPVQYMPGMKPSW